MEIFLSKWGKKKERSLKLSPARIHLTWRFERVFPGKEGEGKRVQFHLEEKKGCDDYLTSAKCAASSAGGEKKNRNSSPRPSTKGKRKKERRGYGLSRGGSKLQKQGENHQKKGKKEGLYCRRGARAMSHRKSGCPTFQKRKEGEGGCGQSQ